MITIQNVEYLNLVVKKKDAKKLLQNQLLILKNQSIIMDTIEQSFQAAFDRIDQASNAAAAAVTKIAEKFAAFEAALKTSGLTVEQEATLLRMVEGQAANAEAIAATLIQLGKDTVIVAEPPVEPPPPLVEPPVEPPVEG